MKRKKQNKKKIPIALRKEITQLSRSYETAYYREVRVEKVTGRDYKRQMDALGKKGTHLFQDDKEYLAHVIDEKAIGPMQYRKDLMEAYDKNGMAGMQFAVGVIKERLAKCKFTFPQYYHLLDKAKLEAHKEEDETKLRLLVNAQASLIEYHFLTIVN